MNQPLPIQPDVGRRRLEQVLMLIIAVAAIVAFIPSWNGEWVYDDELQIVNNPLIKNKDLLKRALLTDVWNFRRVSESQSPSRYWRPTFVAWMVWHERTFGTTNPLPWRISVTLTHALACLLAYVFARKLQVGPWLATLITLIFAVHPSRVESVAWISGATDPLMCVFLLGAAILLLNGTKAARGMPEPANRESWRLPYQASAYVIAATLLFALAVGTKEAGIMFVPLVAVLALRWHTCRDNGRLTLNIESIRTAVGLSLPFAAVALVFLMMRHRVLGPDFRNDLDFNVNLLTLPKVGLFYLKHAFLPYPIGPNYVLDHVRSASVNDVLLPGLLFVTIGSAMLWLAFGPLRTQASIVGLAIWTLLLAPCAYVIHFLGPDHLVHDRYLYFPIFGLALIVVPGVAAMGRKLSGVSQRTRSIAGSAIAMLALLALTTYTVRYAQAWRNDVALWGWGIQTEKNSPFLWQSYGTKLMETRRYPEAIEALNRALELKIEGGTYLALGKTYYEMGRYDEAEREFRRVYDRYTQFSHYPQEFYFCVALLADIRNNQRGDVDGAIELFERLAEVMPASRAIAFDHIAEICIQHQMFDRALQYLLKGEPLIESSYAPKARLILFRLGQVYARQGRLDEASIKFGAFLSATANLDDDVVRAARQVAEDSINAIHRLKHSPSPSPKASP